MKGRNLQTPRALSRAIFFTAASDPAHRLDAGTRFKNNDFNKTDRLAA